MEKFKTGDWRALVSEKNVHKIRYVTRRMCQNLHIFAREQEALQTGTGRAKECQGDSGNCNENELAKFQ